MPVSLIGTFGAMYLLGFSLDNLSLMALTIATGFVVDDAIVVLENITPPHRARACRGSQAALRGAREVGFTVLSMSLSLIAVFMPILLMGGIVGRLFREFAVTLSVAMLISLVVSLTTTPMMCALILPRQAARPHGRLYRVDRARLRRDARASIGARLQVALRHPLLVDADPGRDHRRSTSTCSVVMPYGFFPEQDTGR